MSGRLVEFDETRARRPDTVPEQEHPKIIWWGYLRTALWLIAAIVLAVFVWWTLSNDESDCSWQSPDEYAEYQLCLQDEQIGGGFGPE